MKTLLLQSFTPKDLIHWIPRIITAIIIGQTLPFKFLGAEESVWIFEQLYMEPYGRLVIGISELIAIGLLVTRYYAIGAFISLIIVGTANVLHLTILGIEIQNDGGLLFLLSIIVVVCSLWILIYNVYQNRSKSRIV